MELKTYLRDQIDWEQPFPPEEYAERRAKVRAAMAEAGMSQREICGTGADRKRLQTVWIEAYWWLSDAGSEWTILASTTFSSVWPAKVITTVPVESKACWSVPYLRDRSSGSTVKARSPRFRSLNTLGVTSGIGT